MPPWARTILPIDELVVDAERLARAASSAGCGLWELDVTTGAAWVTAETRRLYGLTPDEPATWEGFVRLLHPEDRDEVVAKVKAVIATDGVFDERHRIVLPDGAVRWVHVTARTDGPNRLLGASVDETERVEAERLAKEHETRVLMAAAAAGLGFSEWTTTARPYLDARFLDFLGVEPDQLDEARVLWLSRIHDEDRPKLEDASRRLMAAEADHIVMEYRYRHPQRGETWLRHSTCRVPLERSADVRLIGALEDITARKRHEEHLRQRSEDLAKENVTLREEVRRRLTPGHIVGRSAAIRRPLALAEQVAATDSTALLLGETGTGKERFANYIHECSRRRNRLMIVVNCSAIPTPLLESELFGREKGAYTGALSRQVGRFELAHGSTLFLDEVGRTAAGSPGQAPPGAREPHHRAARQPETDCHRRAHHRGHASRPGGGRPRRPLPGRPLLPPERLSDSRSRRCASAGRTSRRWSGRSSKS